jgi:hypothetical protein
MRLLMQILMITTIASNITPPATPPLIAAIGNVFDAASETAVTVKLSMVVYGHEINTTATKRSNLFP